MVSIDLSLPDIPSSTHRPGPASQPSPCVLLLFHRQACERVGLCGALTFLSSSFPLLITPGTGVTSLLGLVRPSLLRFYVMMAAFTPNSSISGFTVLILELKSDCREHWSVGKRTECLEPSITTDL